MAVNRAREERASYLQCPESTLQPHKIAEERVEKRRERERDNNKQQ